MSFGTVLTFSETTSETQSITITLHNESGLITDFDSGSGITPFDLGSSIESSSTFSIFQYTLTTSTTILSHTPSESFAPSVEIPTTTGIYRLQ